MALLSRVFHNTTDSRESSPKIRTREIKALHLDQKDSTYALGITIESPPIILYGNANESTGSIISGLLTLEIQDRNADNNSIRPITSNGSYSSRTTESGYFEKEVDSVTLSLVQTIHYTKPFIIPLNTVACCKNCTTKTTELARWDVLTSRASFAPGRHAYPFSHLVPGSLPASTKLGSSNSGAYIKYGLIAVSKTPDGKENKVKLPVNISRLILRGPDRNSLRVFPPTDVTVSSVLPNVIYPKSSFPIELRMNNVVSKKGDRRWRMRKLSWRIEEHTKVKAHTCPAHEGKLKLIYGQQKRTQLNRELKTGHSSNKSSSHLHHSTIQTNMVVTNNSIEGPILDPQAAGGDELDEDNNEPYPQTPNPTDSFVEDFLLPTMSNASGSPNSFHPSPSISSNNIYLSQPSTPTPTEELLYLVETRTVSHGDLKSGWKSDYSFPGKIEMVVDLNITNFSTGINKHQTKRTSNDLWVDDNQEGLRNGANVSCDLDDPTLGVHVSHLLLVEVVVAEELIHSTERKLFSKASESLTPINSSSSVSSKDNHPATPPPQMGTPTGAARVLRMQFKLQLTERSGLGIAWDDEVPPTYEDVSSLSPPTYIESSHSTPVTTPSLISLHSNGSNRPTPNVLYGIGDTPLIGRRPESNTISIDNLIELDRVHELKL